MDEKIFIEEKISEIKETVKRTLGSTGLYHFIDP